MILFFLFFISLIIQTLILLVFVIQSARQRKRFSITPFDANISLNNIDVIIAAHEDFDVIQKCINNVLSNGFNNIILCLDGTNSTILSRIKKDYPSINILSNNTTIGKIESQIKCLQASTKETVLILDADITLIEGELDEFVSYYYQTNVDFLCPYSEGYLIDNNSFLFGLSETDRYMRQRIVRAGRDAFGVSNLSGYCLLANRLKYLEIINKRAIQDDVIATFNLMRKGYTIKTYHRVVCKEIERDSIGSLIMQKTRWTAGNVVLLKSYLSLFKLSDRSKALAFISSSLLWYWSLWLDFFALIVAYHFPYMLIILLIESTIKYFGLIDACKPQKRHKAILRYILFWPTISTLCLFLSPLYLSGIITDTKTRR